MHVVCALCVHVCCVRAAYSCSTRLQHTAAISMDCHHYRYHQEQQHLVQMRTLMSMALAFGAATQPVPGCGRSSKSGQG